MARGKLQPKPPSSSPDTPALAHKTVPPSPPLTSPSPSLSPLPRRPLNTRKTRRPALPRSVAAAFQHLRQAHLGRYTGPSWLQFSDVNPDDLEALVSATRSFKYRFDYEPSKRQLTLRMPEGEPHIFTKNGFARSVEHRMTDRLFQAIQEQDSQADTDTDADLRSIKIALNVEGKVKFPNGGEKRPDVACVLKKSRYPPLVIEVGHSQKAQSLAALTYDYINQTNGAIHTVITAKFVHLGPEQRREKRHQAKEQQAQPPRRTTRSQTRQEDGAPAVGSEKSAHISLYRLGKRVIHDQEFRDAEGRPRSGGLELSVADFVPWAREGTAPAGLEQLTFTVPFSELCDALEWGEEQQALEEQTPVPDAEPVRAGQKRVHFEWSRPGLDPDIDDADFDTNTDAEKEYSGAGSSSKRPRIGDPDTPGRASRSRRRQQGDAVVAHRRRRSSSRLRQHATQSA